MKKLKKVYKKARSNVFKYWKNGKERVHSALRWMRDRIEERTAKAPLADFNSMPKQYVRPSDPRVWKKRATIVFLGLCYSSMTMMVVCFFTATPVSWKLLLVGASLYFLAHDIMDWIERTVKGMRAQ